jgi:membrane protein
MNPIDRVVAAWDAAIDRGRARSRRFDHVWQARERYSSLFGPRLAAAIAYYGFFAAFAIGLLGYSVLGFVLGDNRAVLNTVDTYLQRNLPFLNPSAIQSARNTVAVIGVLGLLFAGIGWIDSMRSSQRAMWGLEQHPGNIVIRWLVDFGMLVGLGVVLGVGLWASNLLQDLIGLVLRQVGLPAAAVDTTTAWTGEVLAAALNLLMSAALLILVPRVWVSWYRIVVPMVLVGTGLTFLTTLGRLYIAHTERNPAYRVAGTAVGLLLFLNLFSQLLLFGSALAATGTRGRVRDLAAGAHPVADRDGDATVG